MTTISDQMGNFTPSQSRGVTKLQALYRGRAVRKKVASAMENPICGVCLDRETEKGEKPVFTRCMHLYHQSCLDTNVRVHHRPDRCPTCRAPQPLRDFRVVRAPRFTNDARLYMLSQMHPLQRINWNAFRGIIREVAREVIPQRYLNEGQAVNSLPQQRRVVSYQRLTKAAVFISFMSSVFLAHQAASYMGDPLVSSFSTRAIFNGISMAGTIFGALGLNKLFHHAVHKLQDTANRGIARVVNYLTRN